MTLAVHRPYPGVALVVTEQGSVLLGAPADAFKATKSYCQTHSLPFPRILVAPPCMLVDAVPQFNPEFFLYDFLFVYGAAFKPELAEERLVFVAEAHQVESIKRALTITLIGPTAAEMQQYKTRHGKAAMDSASIDFLTRLSTHMAIKKGDRLRTIDDSVVTTVFDASGKVRLFAGGLEVSKEDDTTLVVRYGSKHARIDLSIHEPVVPFATLLPPSAVPWPETFALKALGTRSGFDLSGPTTGFMMWINGRAVIYDGPVGTRYLLEHQGIAFSDVDGIILSHCHEDHMGAFVELILAGHRPKVYTAEPVYRSALVKLASYFSRSEQDVASFIDYVPVTPGEPTEILGAVFNFFYTIHAIPTLGVNVQMQHRKAQHTIQISGDTLHHDGLDKLLQEGVIDQVRHRQMRHLVPAKRMDKSVFFADVGEALIHGHPKDWADNPNHVVYYHCPDNEHTRSFNHAVANPGEIHTLVAAPKMHPIISARILRALKFLNLTDPGWLTAILYQGRSRHAAAGTILANEDSDGKILSVIVAGTAAVQGPKDTTVTTLHPGEFFGLMEWVTEDQRFNATVRAETPIELFDIEAHVIDEYVQRNGLQEILNRIWKQRKLVEKIKLFRWLDVGMRNEIAKIADPMAFADDAIIIEEDTSGDDFYMLIRGRVAVERAGKRIATIDDQQTDNFFGEICAIFPARPRTTSVRALGDVDTLRVSGAGLRSLFQEHMAFRYRLEMTLRSRTGEIV